MTDAGLARKWGLDAADTAQVRALAEAVRRADGVALKLNWDGQNRPGDDHAGDLCYYDGGRLVGYAPLDGDGGEMEVTAGVLPSHRRRGVFRQLLAAAQEEARRRGARSLLLVGYRASQSGAAAVRALGLRYVSSEYRMEAEAAALPPLDPGRMRLVSVDASNVADLARLRALCFGGEPRPAEALLAEVGAAGARYFLAEVDGSRIGQVGVLDTGGGIYVRAVGIVPECRRRGYGRQLLAAALRAMLSEGHTHFALDVATENAHALSLYESCGFRETMVYEYSDVPLTGCEGP